MTVTPASLWLRQMADAVAAPLATRLQPAAVVLVYVVVLGVIHGLGELPVSFYRSFVLEHRYGLSTEPFGHWVVDQVKGATIGAALSCAGFSLLYWAVRLSPERWWIVAAAGYAVVVVVATGLAPIFLLPVFFTFRPLGRQELGDRLLELSRRAGVAVTDVSEWQVSDRTRKANAALAGLGRTRRILVSDTLLASHPDDEIEAILAHELAHQAHGDLWRGIALQSVVAAVGFFAASHALTALAPRLVGITLVPACYPAPGHRRDPGSGVRCGRL